MKLEDKKPVTIRRLFCKYNRRMRWRIIVGIGLLLIALALLVVTLAVPASVSQETRVTTAAGVEGVLQVDYPLSGWAGDWRSVNVSFKTVKSTGSEEPLTIRSRIETDETVVDPEGGISSNIQPGGTASFEWRLRGLEKGESRNVIWVYAQEAGHDEQLLFAREFTYTTLAYGFLSSNAARSLMAIIALAGLILFAMPNFKQLPEQNNQ